MRDINDIKQAVANSFSIRSALKRLGLVPAGGNYECLKKKIKELCLDTSHFTGQAHLRGKTHSHRTRLLSEILVKGKLENTWRLKNRLIGEGFKLSKCECCRSTEWLNRPISLELHHKDGNRTNNELPNLELLCPNCHSYTDNYRGRNKKV